MNPTIPTPANQPTTGTELTLDELVALSLSAGELDVISAYVAFCGGSILSWSVKLGRGQS